MESVNDKKERLHDILARTGGKIVYSEQLIDILCLGGFSPRQAQLIRKKILKRQTDYFHAYYLLFLVELSDSLTKDEILDLWGDLTASSYVFNESHVYVYHMLHHKNVVPNCPHCK